MKRRHHRIGKLAAKAVEIAEELFPETGAGKQKRQWVIEFLNDKINLPGINENLEARVLGVLVDIVVDLVIHKSK